MAGRVTSGVREGFEAHEAWGVSTPGSACATGYRRAVLPGSRGGPGVTASRDEVKVSRLGPGHLHIVPEAGPHGRGQRAAPDACVLPGTPGTVPGTVTADLGDIAPDRTYPGAHRARGRFRAPGARWPI